MNWAEWVLVVLGCIIGVGLLMYFLLWLVIRLSSPSDLAKMAGPDRIAIPQFWLSKTFWVNFCVIVIMAVQYVENWPNNPSSWLFWEGAVLGLANYILNQLQGITVKYLKKTCTGLRQQLANGLGHKDSG